MDHLSKYTVKSSSFCQRFDALRKYSRNSSESFNEMFLIVLGGLVLTIPAKLLCGGFAGALAQSFAYPFDVTRRRMQLAMMNPETAKFG